MKSSKCHSLTHVLHLVTPILQAATLPPPPPSLLFLLLLLLLLLLFLLLFLLPSTHTHTHTHTPPSHVYHLIRPSRAPGFSYSWLELISHRTFIAKLLLQTPQQKVSRTGRERSRSLAVMTDIRVESLSFGNGTS